MPSANRHSMHLVIFPPPQSVLASTGSSSGCSAQTSNRGAGPSLLSRLCGFLLRTCKHIEIPVVTWQALVAISTHSLAFTALHVECIGMGQGLPYQPGAHARNYICRQTPVLPSRSHMSALQLRPLHPHCSLGCSRGSASAVVAIISNRRIPRKIQRRALRNLRAA